MSLFLAIDGGGTKTRCLLADDTRVLARARTGTVKPVRVSEQEATVRLHAMLAAAAASAGVSLTHITRTCFGLAGLSSPAVRAWASRTLSESVAGGLLLCGDEEIALDAAFADGPGILVVAGTGSNAIGRTPTGETYGAGGWGPVLGDEGSGHWIGLEAVRSALRAHDRNQPGDPSRKPFGDFNRDPNRPQECNGGDAPATMLLREIARHWGLDSLGDLVAYANQRVDAGHPAPCFAALAPVVARSAEQGDALAAQVLQRAGEELAGMVALVFHKMTAAQPLPQDANNPVPAQSTATEAAPVRVAFTGGVLTHIVPVRDAMTARLAVSVPAALVRESPIDPLEGALARARRG